MLDAYPIFRELDMSVAVAVEDCSDLHATLYTLDYNEIVAGVSELLLLFPFLNQISKQPSSCQKV